MKIKEALTPKIDLNYVEENGIQLSIFDNIFNDNNFAPSLGGLIVPKAIETRVKDNSLLLPDRKSSLSGEL